MKVIFKSSFERDLKKIGNKSLVPEIEKMIENIEKAANVNDIENIKKLSGYKTFYRIKIKDFRLGLNIENDTVYFVRFLPRKDIYKLFP